MGKKADKKAKGLLSPPPVDHPLLKPKQEKKLAKFEGILESGGVLGPKQQKKYDKITNIAEGGSQNINDKFTGLTPSQGEVINQQTAGDIALGSFANTLTPEIWESYNEPFDWTQGPQNPVGDDFNAWRQSQIDQGNQAFDARMNPVFQQEKEEFEQFAANHGWTPGSEVYDREKSRMEQGQNDARTQGYFQASQDAGQNARQFFDIGTEARGNYLGEQFSQRNLPLTEYGMLKGAQSPMGMQNLQYSQQMGLQNDAQKAAQQLQSSAWHPTQAAPYGGFGSQQEYDAYSDARSRGNAQWEYANNPQYQQPKKPSVGSQVAGGILGIGSGILGGYLAG